jgi:hypothetical protein
MKRFGDSSIDLFGRESFDDMSKGEFFLSRHTLPGDCIERADWVMLHVPEFDGNPWRIFRRSMEARMEAQQLLQRDAKEALCIMRGIVNGVQRWFPRQDLPGHPSIRNELLRRS